MLIWQALFIIGGVALLPFAPALYALGRYTRWKVGILPAAGGALQGSSGEAREASELLVIGESTAAGLGAATHDRALAGQFAGQLADRLAKGVNWTVVGKSGVTAERTLRELVPQVPREKRFDYILLAIGGNDVLKLSSPRRWRRSMRLLLGELRRLNPDAAIFITNCPMINASPVIPQPIKGILWSLSRLHDANIRELAAATPRVFYYHQPHGFNPEGFFADGIHPSEQGYADWSAAMMDFFDRNYEWRRLDQK
jgi:lysophospholipase L1-like esterase